MRMIAIAIMFGLSACSFDGNDDDARDGVQPGGSGTARSYPATGFSDIDLRGSDNIDVRVGTGFSVRAEGPSDELDRLTIARDGDTLKVGRKPHNGIGWVRGHAVRVYVTMPRLAAATVSGSGTMTVDRVEGARFTGSVNGSGGLDLAALQVEKARFAIAGSGTARIGGNARTLSADIAGSGDLDAPRLTASQAKIAIAGSGNVRAVVDGPAKVDILGSGDVDLGPGARCTVSKMGSGSVRCGG